MNFFPPTKAKGTGNEKSPLLKSTITKSELLEKVIEGFLFVNGFLSVLLISLIFIFLFKEGLLAFKEVKLYQFLGGWQENVFTGVREFRASWQPISETPKFSILPLLCGSFLVAVPAIIISSTFGIGIGIYLSEFASRKVREIGKPVIEFLSGLPTVVIGFFFLTVIADMMQKITGSDFRLNAFVGALGVSVVTIPLIASLTEDSLRSVPKTLRTASLAMGATPWETAWNIVLPAAISGISASVLLGFGRALGETMIVLMATGNGALITGNIFSTVRTMTATIASELGAVAQGSPQYHALFLVGAILFTITFFFNLLAERIIHKARLKLRM